MLDQQRVETFVDRFLQAADSEARSALLADLAVLTGVDKCDLEAHLACVEDREYLVERIMLFEPGDLKRSKEDLVALVQRIIDGRGSTAEVDECLRVIAANVPAPVGFVTDLIYYPEGNDPPSAQVVVDRALAFVPERIIVTPPSRS